MYFDLHVNKDGIKEGKVVGTVDCITYLQNVAYELLNVLHLCLVPKTNSQRGHSFEGGFYLSESCLGELIRAGRFQWRGA